MTRWKQYRWLVAVAVGLLGGLALSGLWPHTPLYAVATDRTETFGMATGPVDTEVEAVYFLDFLTGDLRAVVLGKQPGTWTGFFQANVAADLGIDQQKNPKFMMVTGLPICGEAAAPVCSRAAPCATWRKSLPARSRPTPCLGRLRCMRPASRSTGDLIVVGVTRFRQGHRRRPKCGSGAADPLAKGLRGRD